MKYKFTSAGQTDVGKKRSHNEDAFAIHEDHGLFVMCDGMGGHASGEVASQLAVDEIANFFTSICREEGFDWPESVAAQEPFEARALDGAIQHANYRIFVESMKSSELEGMGTTVCAIATSDERMAIAHVGDSRVYRYRDNSLVQLTEDHSLINHYRKQGELSEAELEALGNKKNVIVRALGLKDEVLVDVAVEDLAPDDIFLVCSDGLTDCAADWLIEQTLGNHRDDLEMATQQLVDLANDGGGKDNITILLVHVAEASARVFSWSPTVPEASPLGYESDEETHEAEVTRETSSLEEELPPETSENSPPQPPEQLELNTDEDVFPENRNTPISPPPPPTQRKRLKIVVSSGEVDLLGDEDPDEIYQEETSRAERESTGQTKASWVADRVEDPELRNILKNAIPGLVPED